MSDILHFLIWYLIISITGLAALPLGFRFFPRLPSRGYALVRPLGLLIWGFVFWLLTSLGVLQNDLGGVILAFAVLIAFGVWAGTGGKFAELTGWLKQNLRLILTVEGLFFAAFLLWTLVRGMDPDVAYTEKPMELAFINAILRSPTFPPMDPWLSGYAISYYYFGYILIAMLTRVSGAASAVAFNLSSALWFAMTATALYGIVYDLVLSWQQHRSGRTESGSQRIARAAGFLGPLFVLITSTYEGVLEFLYAGGVFWHKVADGTYTSKFWTWLGILDLNEPPTPPFNWIPSRTSGWLWWRGSRVLQDLSLTNQHVEVIDEFPFFSYLLSDLHPHVLAMPFALLAIGVSLNFFLGADQFLAKFKNIQGWMKSWSFWLTALILGSLAFINTWDFPIYVGLLCFTWGYIRYRNDGWKWKVLWEFIKNGFILGMTGVVLFLPFYIGFASQAGGILPSMEFMTKGVHFWILFGALLIPIVWWLIHRMRQEKGRQYIKQGFQIALTLMLGLFILMILYGLVIFGLQTYGPVLAGSANPSIAGLGAKMIMGGQAFAGLHENFPASEVVREAVLRRITSPGTWLTLGVMLVLALGLLLARNTKEMSEEHPAIEPAVVDVHPQVEKFVLILLGFGLALTIFPEFFYLRDQFGWRMNTIFKFYFQAWILWGISAAVLSVWLFQSLKKWKGAVFQIVWVISMLAGLAYPSIMLWTKTNHFSMKEWTLNGNAYIERNNPDEYNAITWLQSAPLGVVSEAIGGSYTEYARVSTRSGQPTVLGWPGHESQWRGGGTEMGSRFDDIRTLYEAKTWEQVEPIIEQYNIRYIYVGGLENLAYHVDTGKFNDVLEPVYSNQNVTIYEVPSDVGELKP
jgi:YYY domain-containing protein